MSTQLRTNSQVSWFAVITGIFVAVLIISNLASTKIVHLWRFTFDGGTLLFPISYIFGDILTEVFGYARSRLTIWTGFAANILMAGTLGLVAILPSDPSWPWQDAFRALFGLVPNIVVASLIAYVVGEFTNSYILAKLKLRTHGRMLWLRTIGSTLVGEFVDTVLFVGIAFAGTLSIPLMVSVAISNYIFKVGIEVIMTPITYLVANRLKRTTGEDAFDAHTSFTPFRLRPESEVAED